MDRSSYFGEFVFSPALMDEDERVEVLDAMTDGLGEDPTVTFDGISGECRSCWDKDSGSVNYEVHGARAKRLEQESRQRLLPIAALFGAIGTGRVSA